jgi:hypothetical protein
VAIPLQSRRGEEGLPKTEIDAREIEKALLVSGVSVSIMAHLQGEIPDDPGGLKR